MVLRDLAPRDVGPFLAAFAADPDLAVQVGYEEDPTPASLRKRLRSEPRERSDGEGIRFAIAGRDDDAFLGQISLHSLSWAHRRGEVGFFVVPAARGRGVAGEALRLVVGWAFSALGLVRVGLATLTGNGATIAVAERAGFVREGILRAYTFERGAPVDNLVFGAVRGDAAWA